MTVSCVIPYWNEAPRIRAVLAALEKVSLIQEIILIDDGSTDGGVQTNAPRILQHRFEKNQGKSAAMRYGFWKAKGDIILFLDADLMGINAKNIEDLLLPLINGTCEFTTALREYFLFFDVVAGERALIKKDWESFFLKEKFNGNATEIGMNRYVLLNNIRVKAIAWNNVRQVYKSSKIGFYNGMIKDIKHILDWRKQLGITSFSCTYLLYWLLIAKGETRFLQKCKGWYRKMFEKQFEHLLF